MRATDYAWGHTLQLEANRCWFWAICASILICCYQLLQTPGESRATTGTPKDTSTTTEGEKLPDTRQTERSEEIHYMSICRQLLIDGCDLIIAGSSVGWVSADEVRVGTAYMISSAVAGQQLWERVQNGP